MELIVGGKDGLQPVERTVIDRCVRQMYREHLQDPETSKMPKMCIRDRLCAAGAGPDRKAESKHGVKLAERSEAL